MQTYPDTLSAMLQHAERFIYRVCGAFFGSLGTTALGFFVPLIISAVSIGITLTIIFRRRGKEGVKQHWQESVTTAAWVSVTVLFAVYGTIFAWNIIKEVYVDHATLVQEKSDLSAEVTKLKTPTPNAYRYRNEIDVRTVTKLGSQLTEIFGRQLGGQKKPTTGFPLEITFVFTAPKENEAFKNDLESLVILGCHSLTSPGCNIEPVPNPEIEVDTGIPAPRYPGIVLHWTESTTGPIKTVLENYLGKCFIVRNSPLMPTAVSKLNVTQSETFVWLEIGRGSPWNMTGGCGAN
jgi:hypothetical protein